MTYRRLAPRERRVFSYHDLYAGPDHLLYVASSRFSDRYFRFRFVDIQTLVLTELPLWTPWLIVWLAVSFLLTAAVIGSASGRMKWWAVPPALSLLWACLHALRGPRCRLVLHTAVSATTLAAVSTVKRARRVMPELLHLIEMAQGPLPEGSSVQPQPVATTAAVGAENPSAGTFHRSLLLRKVLFAEVLGHAVLIATLYFAGRMQDAVSLSFGLLVAEIVMAGILLWQWKRLSGTMALMAIGVILFALADSGILVYTGVRTFGDIFATVRDEGRAPDLKWFWLQEQTVLRAAWHTVLGVAGWIAILVTSEPEP